MELDTYGIKVIEEVFKKEGLQYKKGKVWTTDAPYRETRKKMLQRKEQGCIAVEIECATLAAAAKFRGITLHNLFMHVIILMQKNGISVD